jgi:hypothetical protein|tara:strand:+ start:966 stop:1265 length:300 start_codon:yes stop_codon:yes gene_type:complete
MDIYLHTAISVGAILIAYVVGNCFSMAKHISYGVEYTLNKLEKENCIRIAYNRDGEKKIVSHLESYKELYTEIDILKGNVYDLEKQLNTCRKKSVDKLV